VNEQSIKTKALLLTGFLAAGAFAGRSLTLREARATQSVTRRATLQDQASKIASRLCRKALDLDAKQQAALRKVLEGQREQVRKVWSTHRCRLPTASAPSHASATRRRPDQGTIERRTEKKHYNPPKRRARRRRVPPGPVWRPG